MIRLKSYTLTELLVVMIISTIVITLIYWLFSFADAQWFSFEENQRQSNNFEEFYFNYYRLSQEKDSIILSVDTISTGNYPDLVQYSILNGNLVIDSLILEIDQIRFIE